MALSVFALVLVPGCVFLFKEAKLQAVNRENPPTRVSGPVKVHLTDGSIALFRAGARFSSDSVRGKGVHYGLALEDSTRVRSLPLDSVAALETYRESVRPAPSIMVSTLATAAGAVGSVALFKALFGSCPTVYSQSDSLVLEAESFSNSIVPLFEMRDVDHLTAQADESGELTLEIRNEALETHYINHLELLEVSHAPHENAFPADAGKAWVVSDVRMPSRMRDQAGRDVSEVLAVADGHAYRTPASILAAVDSTRMEDHIDVSLPAPARDTAVVVLRLRNSLLNTLLFYDYMLAGQGARSLDWLGEDMSIISSAIELSDFYARRMGLHVQIRSEGTYQTVGRVREVGPIAWSREAVAVPVPAGADSLYIRLSFVADAWRIDQVAVAHEAHSVYPMQHTLASVRTPGHAPDSALGRLRAPDLDYWVTLPTDRFWATFRPSPASRDVGRTFFLAAQGYYTEWIRRAWLDRPVRSERFVLSDPILEEALHEWRRSRLEWERKFEASKLPVR